MPDSAASQTSPRPLSRLMGHLRSVLPSGGVRFAGEDTIELVLTEDETATGGIAMISFDTDIECRKCGGARSRQCAGCNGAGREHELVSFWLSIPARPQDGAVVQPTLQRLKLVNPITFVVRTPHAS